ncbi:glycosyltransferase (plasmid) [Roseovarius faecimaris]|uniref:Glycosyltransferase n=1 Tax=Roseovarius faecimaris TaxID=2494550 RepID=A0A6I6ILK8_9RHOB|nr:glycosyltransferase [Roseovarius faecimaris]QGX96761.1 glycosyltransferase [Roseovarius faecimaris]
MIDHACRIRKKGKAALCHFLAHGCDEGRDPSPAFSVRKYVAQNPTVDFTAQNPFLHWLTQGRPALAETAEEYVLCWMKRSRAEFELLQEHFDAAFYLDRNEDVKEAGIDPLYHFLVYGWKERRDPSPAFSVRNYIAQNPTVDFKAENPFLHWLNQGRPELTGPAEEYVLWYLERSRAEFELLQAHFDAAFYLDRNEDVKAAGIDPFYHFLAYGWKENRDPSPEFSVRYYQAKNADLAGSGWNPFVHWVLHGQAEGRAGIPRPGDAQTQDQPDLENIDWSVIPQTDIDDISELFDAGYYLKTYPEVAEHDIDPRAHYLLLGWRLGYNPSDWFSTNFYMHRYMDIRRARVIPFLHYCRHGRHENRETRSHIDIKRAHYQPKVSVIVPNYNHAPFLRDRLSCIAGQSYRNIELIILDDHSSDNSREVITELVREMELDAQLVFNDANAGNVFRQWETGVSLATGELIWICESDDFCELDFLEKLVPAFLDDSVTLAFGRIQFVDKQGRFKEGLDGYREGAESGIWSRRLTRPAAEWFNGGFGVNNVIANVGGCVFRRVALPAAVWDQAKTYRICGDWFLYLHLAGMGQITFEPEAVSYFRQHGRNTSVSNFTKKYYYDEHIRILEAVIARWGISEATRRKFLDKLKIQYERTASDRLFGPFEALYDYDALLAAERTEPHIQFHFLGFQLGGGEIFPINLANALLAKGVNISMLATDLINMNDGVRALLDPRIPVYSGLELAMRGRADFLDAAGVSVIHSHVAASDALLANADMADIERPYVVTLHGSYVGLEEAPKAIVDWILRNVDHWVYLTGRNLEFFEHRPVPSGAVFEKLPNAMPPDPAAPRFSRKSLGIGKTDLVFVLVGRAVPGKGWHIAVEAFRQLPARLNGRKIHLLMVGDGESAAPARALAEGQPNIHFVGYQKEVNGILRLSDCMILPTRFEGESYPLCLVQALQEHVPVIATDIGEISHMMRHEDQLSGLLLDYVEEDDAFVRSLCAAITQMADPDRRAGFAQTAKACAQRYDMARLAMNYLRIYDEVLARRASDTHPARPQALAHEGT